MVLDHRDGDHGQAGQNSAKHNNVTTRVSQYMAEGVGWGWGLLGSPQQRGQSSSPADSSQTDSDFLREASKNV